jgi:hypothetical protein
MDSWFCQLSISFIFALQNYFASQLKGRKIFHSFENDRVTFFGKGIIGEGIFKTHLLKLV